MACYRTFPYPEGGLSSKGDEDSACRRVETKPITIHCRIRSSLSLSLSLSLSFSLALQVPLCAAPPNLDIDNETMGSFDRARMLITHLLPHFEKSVLTAYLRHPLRDAGASAGETERREIIGIAS